MIVPATQTCVLAAKTTVLINKIIFFLVPTTVYYSDGLFGPIKMVIGMVGLIMSDTQTILFALPILT